MLLASSALEPGDNTPEPPPQPAHAVPGALDKRVLEDLLGPDRDHVRQTGCPSPVAYGSEVDDDSDIAVAPLGVTPHRRSTTCTRAKHRRIIIPEHFHPLESVGCLVEDLLGTGQDRAVGGVPGDPQAPRDPEDRHALQSKDTQPPLDGRASHMLPRLGHAARVLPPHSRQ